MNKLIMIKYGELNTKGDNKKQFINTLYSNILKSIKEYNVTMTKSYARMYIEFDEIYQSDIITKLSNTFGIYSFIICTKINSDKEIIEEYLINLVKNIEFQTFKVISKRANKQYPMDSMAITKYFGGVILKNKKDIKVDVHKPDISINIEIRDDSAYIYTNKDEIKGLGGFPISKQTKGMLMLSGGIDSPVSGFLSMKRGVHIDCVYFESLPHTSIEARNKVISLIKKLNNYQKDINLHIVPFTKIQEKIYTESNQSYLVTLMRRFMYRITEKLAHENECKIIVTGESIGQVASQTLDSMNVINECINMPVIRPVACFDKNEIIEIARKIDTYETSIIPYEDCCTVFKPKNPVINPTLKNALKYESIFNINELIDECIKDIITMKITNEEKNFFDL